MRVTVRIKKIFNQRNLVIGLVAGAFLLVSTNVALATIYQDRIYPGVSVGSTHLGGKTRAQAIQVLEAQVRAYHLSLIVDKVKHNIKPQDLGADYDTNLTVDQAFAAGRNDVFPMVGLVQAIHQKPLSLAFSIDRVALAKFTSAFVSEQTAAPVDASVIIQNGVPKVQPDRPGLGVNTQALMDALESSVGLTTEQLTIERGPVPADIQTAQAQSVAAIVQRQVNTSLKLTLGDRTITPSSAQIGSWMTFTKQVDGTLAAQVDVSRVSGYLQSVGSQVETPAVTKQISVVNGEVKGEEGGTDGTAIDKATLVPQIIAAISASKAATLAIPMVVVPFKTQYNRTVSLDAPKYIEVNLSTQHLWAYQDHQVVFDSPVTSGATGYGFGTVTGLFSIYAKETNRYLNGHNLGYNYDVFVQYWMPFYADYGLHDASWRNGVFGGQDYYYGGSHGCVNLPLATAAWLFGWAPIGTPVWVHT